MSPKSGEQREMRYKEWRTRQNQRPQAAPEPNAPPDDPWWTRARNPRPGDSWWPWCADWGRDRRGRQHPHGAHPKLFVAIFLICAGGILFLDNLGLLVVRDIWAYWPLIFVAMGISRFTSSPGVLTRFWGVLLVLAGFGLIASNLGFLFITANLVWPILLIVFGAAILIKTFDPHGPPPFGFRRPAPHLPGERPPFPSHNSLREWVVFGNMKRSISAQDFRGGELLSVFGEIKIDLRHAQIPARGGPVVIDANANFGAITISVPESWRVSVRGVGIFGGYEDKTIPPRPQPGFEPPLLIVTGSAIFGAVVVNN